MSRNYRVHSSLEGRKCAMHAEMVSPRRAFLAGQVSVPDEVDEH